MFRFFAALYKEMWLKQIHTSYSEYYIKNKTEGESTFNVLISNTSLNISKILAVYKKKYSEYL